MSASFAQSIAGKLVMAPMTRGTNLPFRRLLGRFGAPVVWGEMVYASRLLRGDTLEKALIRRHPEEQMFGVQLAGKKPAQMAEAAKLVEAEGADFIDINMGCPIDSATRKGCGAALLRKATLAARVVEAMQKAVSIPVTVKLRLGWSDEKPTFLRVAQMAEEAGAAAITLHARSRVQRYRKAADWSAIETLKGAVSVPVIGNGDISHWSEAQARLDTGACDAVMIGRWGLARPWIFQEFNEHQTIEYHAEDRVKLLKQFVELCKETLGDDALGCKRTRQFLIFHQNFFARYRRNHDPQFVNSEDPRDWGAPPEGDLETWLCRQDEQAAEALADWLVDEGPMKFPEEAAEGAYRQKKLNAAG